MASRLLLLTLLFVPSLASAADKATGERLRELEEEIGNVSAEVDDTRLNFSERSGLIGVAEARRRYEDAVYAFLVGDFESAATSFYILVHSRALGNAALAHDSDWYLAECTFELGNLLVAEGAYRAIVDKGPSHPYFVDAVRRNLEVYALLDNEAAFTAFYARWIVSGKVRTTDIVNYTLAKAFARRKEFARAKSMFEAIAPTSPWYTRARYQLGVLMIGEANLKQAVSEFQKVEVAPVADKDQKRVQDLAVLALGRLFYELGDFPQASSYYGRIDKNSPEFAEKLYEAVWSYVKQGGAAEAERSGSERDSQAAVADAATARWQDALGQVDNFLLAFPEHRYTSQLRILQGHLHMKLRSYDAARGSYEDVVAAYTPVAARLDELGQGTAEAQRFIQRLLRDSAGTSGLPAYAIEMLLARPDVARATGVYLETLQQKQELADAERRVAELQTVLSSERDTLGMFVAARNQLTTMRGAALAMRARLLGTELQYLRGKVSASARAEFVALNKELASIEERGSASDSSVGSTTDRVQVYDAQVREVQQRAFRVQQEAEEALATGRGLAEVLGSGSAKLPPADQAIVRTELEFVRDDLAKAAEDLDAVQSEVSRKRVMRSVESGSIKEDDVGRSAMIAQYKGLRTRVAALRRTAQDTDSAANYAQIDRLWSVLEVLETSSTAAHQVVTKGEARETGLVRGRLDLAAREVSELRRGVDGGANVAEAVATRAAFRGIRALRDEFEGVVVDADKGIVDVYWLRRMENTAEQDVLIQDRAGMVMALKDRFKVIRESLAR